MTTVDPLILENEIRDHINLLLRDHAEGDPRAKHSMSLELALNNPTFNGYPIGSTLTDVFTRLFYRRTPGNPRYIARTMLALAVHFSRGVGRPTQKQVTRFDDSRPVLIAITSNRGRNVLWLPELLGRLGPDRCRLFWKRPTGKPIEIPRNTVHHPWQCFPVTPMTGWRREYRKRVPAWHSIIGRECQPLQYGAAGKLTIHHAMLASTQWLSRAERLLDQSNPSVVLVDFDRNIMAAGLVMAARRRGIPTLTLIHGVINSPWGYVPVLADRLLCWGEMQRQQLLELGTDARRIRVVGFERLTKKTAADRASVRTQWNIDHDATVALLATNPIHKNEQDALVETFCRSVSSTQGVAGIIRPHPSQSAASFQHLANKHPRILVIENTAMTLDESAAAADLVVGQATGFLDEAMVKGAVCAVLDITGKNLDHGKDLVRLAKIPYVRSENDLRDLLGRIASDGNFAAGLRAKSESYVKFAFGALGSDAIENIANQICLSGGLDS